MYLKIPIIWENVVTWTTLIWFFTSVCIHMYLKIMVLWESLVTLTAMVWFLLFGYNYVMFRRVASVWFKMYFCIACTISLKINIIAKLQISNVNHLIWEGPGKRICKQHFTSMRYISKTAKHTCKRHLQILSLQSIYTFI